MESLESQKTSGKIPTFLQGDTKWVQTKDDGVLLFKNVSFSVREAEKEAKDENKYPHNEDNIIIDFEDEKEKYEVGFKYYNTEKEKFCSVSSRETEEDGKLKSIKIKFGEEEEELTIQANELHKLVDNLPVKIRILNKSGNKITLKGELSVSDSLKAGLEKAFISLGLKSMKYKVFHGKDVLANDATIESTFKSDRGLDFF